MHELNGWIKLSDQSLNTYLPTANKFHRPALTLLNTKSSDIKGQELQSLFTEIKRVCVGFTGKSILLALTVNHFNYVSVSFIQRQTL